MNLKARSSSKATPAPYLYHWHSMPEGVSKWCPSPIDALLEVLMLELKIHSIGVLTTDLGLEPGAISRCRHRKGPILHIWLLRAMILSGIPYEQLCKVIGEEPQYFPHHNARRQA